MDASPKNARNIFLAAIQLPAEEREAYLREACGDDQELYRRVSLLLQAQAEIGSFHELPDRTVDAPTTESPGALIGPYKLLEQIGEGGMGTVWMAQQTEPVKRLVAVKLIKAGMDSKQVIARFEAERQALALMDHPNIARVLDGGTTDVGRPYFVMDLVRGVPITRYCDEHHLTPRQRLELFLPVCQAVQHAHQKGIIHRDLKPSNVLVAQYDGKPVPKVIDFGVAKAAGQSLTEKTLVTGFGAIVGTLEYMSPEQAEVNQLDIDTRSDIYSLGVLLYELLTGSTPFSKKELEKAGMLEMLRVIREQEPSKPSTKLSTAEGLPTLAANRGTEPAKLTRLVRGELDWIVMKALEKDRTRRYETANGFAIDVQRYLSGEAVHAVPPSAGYRFRKFVRRNKASLGVASLILFFLVLLGSGVGWAWRDRAARAEERANHLERAVERAESLQREGKRGEARAALERAQLLAREAVPSLPLAERIQSLQQLLDAEARDDVFVAQFEAIRREVQTEVDVKESHFRNDKAYPRLREALEQYGIAVGVTLPADAATHIQKRPAVMQTVLVAALDVCLDRAPWKDSDARKWLIDVLRTADGDSWRNKVRRAWKEPATLEALARDIDVRQQPPSFLDRVIHALPIESPSRLALGRRVQFAYPGDFWANHTLAYDLKIAGKHAEAIRYYSSALSLRPDNPGVLLNRANALREAGELEAAVADLRRAIAVAPRYAAAHKVLGDVLFGQKKLDEAIDAYREAIRIFPDDAYAHCVLGDALSDQEKFGEAVVSYQTAIRLQPDYPGAYCNLGNVLECLGKPDDAIAAFREAIRLQKDFAFAHGRLGETLLRQGHLDEGIAELREATRLDPNDYRGHHLLGETLCNKKGDYDGAIAALREAVRLKPDSFRAHRSLGVALRRKGLLDESIAANREAIRLKPDEYYSHELLGLALSLKGLDEEAAAAYREAFRLNPNSADACNGLGNVLDRQNKLDEAIRWYKKAIEIDPKDAMPHYNLGRVAQHRQGKLDEAIDWYRKAIKLNPNYAPAHHNLGLALRAQGKPEAAIAAFKQAVAINPKWANAHYWLAWELTVGHELKLRDPKQALVSARLAVELDPKNGTYWQGLGYAEYRSGNWKAAVLAFQKVKELGSPGDSLEWFPLSMAYWQLGDKDTARKNYEQAVQWMEKNSPKDPFLLSLQAEAAELMGIKTKKD